MKEGELYYTGTIVEIVDKVLYVIKVDIPGLKSGVTAFPMRGEVDEPRVGDFVILRCFDPVFQSYYMYHKIKENDFIGFRSNGKMVDITPDYIQIAIFNPDNNSWNDCSENTETDDLGRVCGGYRPEVTDWIRLDKDGNLNIHIRSNNSVTIEGDADINVNGETTITSPSITIKGPGFLTCKGTVVPSAEGGPFIAVTAAPPVGTPFISGDTIILTDY